MHDFQCPSVFRVLVICYYYLQNHVLRATSTLIIPDIKITFVAVKKRQRIVYENKYNSLINVLMPYPRHIRLIVNSVTSLLFEQ